MTTATTTMHCVSCPPSESNTVIDMVLYTKRLLELRGEAVTPELERVIERCRTVVFAEPPPPLPQPANLREVWNLVVNTPELRSDPSARTAAKVVRAQLRMIPESKKRARAATAEERAGLYVELSHANNERPTEYAFYDERLGRVVRAVDRVAFVESHVGEFGEDFYTDDEFFDNYVEFKRRRFTKHGYVDMNEGYDAVEVFEEFLQVVDDADAFEALEEKYSMI